MQQLLRRARAFAVVSADTAVHSYCCGYTPVRTTLQVRAAALHKLVSMAPMEQQTSHSACVWMGPCVRALARVYGGGGGFVLLCVGACVWVCVCTRRRACMSQIDKQDATDSPQKVQQKFVLYIRKQRRVLRVLIHEHFAATVSQNTLCARALLCRRRRRHCPRWWWW